jgi:hypothetical protein
VSRFRGEYIADRKALHNAVRAEAGNRCIRCGHPEGDRMLVTDDDNRAGEIEVTARNYRWELIEDGRDAGSWRYFIFADCDDSCTHADKGHPAIQKLRILTVHHLTGQKDDNRWWNLLALCQVCHLQIQGKVIPEVPYLWRHSDWFIPYACGFYAAYYGRQDITREEADAEPDRWLRMGQPWLYETG